MLVQKFNQVCYILFFHIQKFLTHVAILGWFPNLRQM